MIATPIIVVFRGGGEVGVSVQWYVDSILPPLLLMVMDRIRMKTTMTEVVVVEVMGYQKIPSLCVFYSLLLFLSTLSTITSIIMSMSALVIW